jgi:hypothetical protein
VLPLTQLSSETVFIRVYLCISGESAPLGFTQGP